MWCLMRLGGGFLDVPLVFGKVALGAPVVHRRQTMSKRVLVAWVGRFPAYPCHDAKNSGDNAVLPVNSGIRIVRRDSIRF